MAFIIACEKGSAADVFAAVSDICESLPDNRDEFVTACMEWLFGTSKAQTKRQVRSAARIPFDFEEDGSVIYCELWEYFPHLMERGISFHEGMELIKLLLHNDSTVLWHRAFARCGDFSKMDKEQQKYWQKQRAIYTITNKNKNADTDVMCGDFW